jgi:hypothetical protein
MGQVSEMESHLCDASAVVGDQALAVLSQGGVLYKLLVSVFETGHCVTGLLYQGVVITFLEAHNFLVLVSIKGD